MQQWRKRARRPFHPPQTFSKTSTFPTKHSAANMAQMTIREALSSTTRAEMERDPNRLILAEDNVGRPRAPADAKGVLTTASRGDDRVMFFEPKMLDGETGDVPDGEYLVRCAHAGVARGGGEATIVGCGGLVGGAAKAADRLAAEG